MVGEHLNVRLALCLRVHSHRQPSAQKWLLQGHCCRCYSVHCPSLSSCCGNGPFWANCLSVAASRPMAVVVLLGTTELFGRLFRVFTWNTANCLFFFDQVIRNNLTSSDTPYALDSGAPEKLWLGPRLGATKPCHQC